MKKNNLLYVSFGILIIIFVWEIISFIVSPALFPDFFISLGNMFKMLFTTSIILDVLFSLLRVLISFSLGLIIGVSLGIISGINKKSEYILLPMMTLIKAVPTIAFILLFMIYFKYSYIYVLTLLIVPIIYQATSHEIFMNNQKYKSLFILRSGKTDLYSIFKVLLPASSVQIVNSFIQSFSLGIKAQVLVESFAYTSSFRGLGKQIYLSFQNSNIQKMISLIIFIILFSLLVDLGLIKLKKKIMTITN